MQSVAWLSTQTVVARPLWTMLHAAAAVVGLLLILSGRQPPWLEVMAKRVWQRIMGLVRQNGLKGAGLLGAAWAFMPCGLLYSALMVASLTDTWASGATYMALFALGSSLSLLAGPWLLLKLAQYRHREIGVRLAGVALLLMAGSTLWMGLVHQQAPWCTLV
jgi:sulfite exporter TauE/SafE